MDSTLFRICFFFQQILIKRLLYQALEIQDQQGGQF